jgi:hypothetical protein
LCRRLGEAWGRSEEVRIISFFTAFRNPERPARTESVEKSKAYNTVVKGLEVREYVYDIDIDGEIILKCVLKK